MLTFEEGYDPATKIGATFQFRETIFEVVGIRGEGQDKIAFSLRDTESGEAAYILKAYRRNIPDSELQRVSKIYEELKAIGVRVTPEAHWFRISGWPVSLETDLGLTLGMASAGVGRGLFAELEGVMAENNLSKAFEICERLHAERPGDPEVMARLAHLYLSNAASSFASAYDLLAEVLEIDPGSESAKLLLRDFKQFVADANLEDS
jgi:hypothetical protein